MEFGIRSEFIGSIKRKVEIKDKGRKVENMERFYLGEIFFKEFRK